MSQELFFHVPASVLSRVLDAGDIALKYMQDYPPQRNNRFQEVLEADTQELACVLNELGKMWELSAVTREADDETAKSDRRDSSSGQGQNLKLILRRERKR